MEGIGLSIRMGAVGRERNISENAKELFSIYAEKRAPGLIRMKVQ